MGKADCLEIVGEYGPSKDERKEPQLREFLARRRISARMQFRAISNNPDDPGFGFGLRPAGYSVHVLIICLALSPKHVQFMLVSLS